jgi:hypothetical protein
METKGKRGMVNDRAREGSRTKKKLRERKIKGGRKQSCVTVRRHTWTYGIKA